MPIKTPKRGGARVPSGGRPRTIQDAILVSFRIPRAYLLNMNYAAQLQGITTSELLRDILATYFDNDG